MRPEVPDHTERLQRTGRPWPVRPRTGRHEAGMRRAVPAYCAKCRQAVEPDKREWRSLYEWEGEFLCRNCWIEAVNQALERDIQGFAAELDLTVLTWQDWD